MHLYKQESPQDTKDVIQIRSSIKVAEEGLLIIESRSAQRFIAHCTPTELPIVRHSPLQYQYVIYRPRLLKRPVVAYLNDLKAWDKFIEQCAVTAKDRSKARFYTLSPEQHLKVMRFKCPHMKRVSPSGW
jgi:hypothetical protein